MTNLARHRRSVRLAGYDYAQPGGYVVTLVTHERQCLFGEVHDGEVTLSDCGEIVAAEWLRSTEIRPEIALDAFVVMPNHVHGIVLIQDGTPVGAHGRAPLRPDVQRAPRSLGSFVAGFKSSVTKRINEARDTPRLPVWQRSYYEHIIRDEGELDRIRLYVSSNPALWEEDEENPNLRAGRNIDAQTFRR